jgi:asparagine synthase (glutamine-hydrolysing)
LVDFSYGLPDQEWIHEDEYKKLLRSVAKDYLPKSIFNRPKQGFVLPMDDWIIKWFKKESVHDFFTSRKIKELNTDKIISWVENELKNSAFNQRLIFALIMLYEWKKVNYV